MLENSSAARHGSEGRPARVRLGSDGRSFRIRSAASNDPKYIPKKPNPRAQDRRRRDLVEAFVNALGEQVGSDLTLVAVRRAAELQAMCEMARANMLNGQPVDMLALVRLEGVAARAIRQLGIKIEPPPAKARGNGIELARQRWAEEAEKAKKATEAREATTAKDTEVPPDDRAA
jgi:hypothetical protein